MQAKYGSYGFALLVATVSLQCCNCRRSFSMASLHMTLKPKTPKLPKHPNSLYRDCEAASPHRPDSELPVGPRTSRGRAGMVGLFAASRAKNQLQLLGWTCKLPGHLLFLLITSSRQEHHKNRNTTGSHELNFCLATCGSSSKAMSPRAVEVGRLAGRRRTTN